jgi:hypothetical protein
MNRHARLRRLERAFFGGDASETELDAAIEAELDKLEPEERERFLLEFLREEGLTARRAGGRRAGGTP